MNGKIPDNILEDEEGFDTPDFEDEVNYDGKESEKVIAPGLCDKMKNYSDCPYNTEKVACLDCEIILSNSDDHQKNIDLGYAKDIKEEDDYE